LFSRWLLKAPNGKIEKVFGINKNDISIAESVKDTEKSILFYFSSKTRPIGEKKKGHSKTEEIKADQLKKQDYYTFQGKIKKDQWKEKDLDVYSFNEIKENNCSECNGRGYLDCKNCKGKGIVACKKCDNKGNITCKSCEKRPGKLIIELEIREVRDGKLSKVKRQITVLCPDCYGKSSISCPECGGKGGNVCQKCRASGRKVCKTCDGMAKIFEITRIPVPFLIEAATNSNFYYSRRYAKELAGIGKDLTEVALKEVEGIEFGDRKRLNKKDLVQALGEVKLDKDIENNMKDALNSLENMERSYKKGSGIEEPLYPIVAYPMSILHVETKKGKKFKLFSIGSEQRFLVLDRGF
jgi:hypothetical protein